VLVEPHATRRRTLHVRLRALGADVTAVATLDRLNDASADVLLLAAAAIPRRPAQLRATAGRIAPRWLCLAPQSTTDLPTIERAGASATLHHPVVTERLVQSIPEVARRGVSDTLASMRPRMRADGPRVLVVEDHPDNRALFRRMLRRLGCDVHVAENGEVGLERVRRYEYDLVLSDIQMPGIDGFGFVRRLRAYEARGDRPRLPVVAVTAHAVEGFAERARELGFDGFETKPLRAGKLERVLAKFVDPRPVVLFAEDDDSSRRVLRLYLESEGRFRTVPCPDGRDALEALRRRRVSLVVLDIEMPGIDGFVAARAIRGNPKTATIPIVGLTGHGDPQTHERMRAAGMDDVLTKPVSRQVLLSAIHARLHLPPATRDPVTAPAPLPKRPAPEVTNTSTGSVVRAAVDSDIADLVPTFLANRRADVSRLETVGTDLEWEDARRMGHGMKGAGGAYGFPEISALGARIEAAAGERDASQLAKWVASLAGFLDSVDA
jgi:CheY-like chemotaxis protein/HPt (histidine-containing phosphotransfer) domain-containing protein